MMRERVRFSVVRSVGWLTLSLRQFPWVQQLPVCASMRLPHPVVNADGDSFRTVCAVDNADPSQLMST